MPVQCLDERLPRPEFDEPEHPWFGRPLAPAPAASPQAAGVPAQATFPDVAAGDVSPIPAPVVPPQGGGRPPTRPGPRHTAQEEPPAGLSAGFDDRDRGASPFPRRAPGGDGVSSTGVFAALTGSPRSAAAALSVGMLGATTLLSGVTGTMPAVSAEGDGPTVKLAVADLALPGADTTGGSSAAAPAEDGEQPARSVESTLELPAPAVDPALPAVGQTVQTAFGQAMGSLPSAFEKADAARIAALQKAAEERAAAERAQRRVTGATGGAAGGTDEGPDQGSVATGSSVGARALAAARTRLGMPYQWGAAGPTAFDCSGLTSWAFKQVGVTLPRTAGAQSTVGTAVSKANLQPGDLVFFYTPVSHVAIYVGNGKVLHASTSGEPVKISDLSSMPFSGARRI